MWLSHLRRYDKRDNATEGDYYKLFNDFDSCIDFAKKTVSEYTEFKIVENDFSLQNDLFYASGFIYTDGFGKKDFNVEYGSRSMLYPSDNYTIKCLEVFLFDGNKLNEWN